MFALITNGGPHPAEKWGEVTSEMILSDIAREAPEVEIAGSFQERLSELLTLFYDRVQRIEKATPGTINVSSILPSIVSTIVMLTKSQPCHSYFLREETWEYLCRVIGQHLSTIIQIEHSWSTK